MLVKEYENLHKNKLKKKGPLEKRVGSMVIDFFIEPNCFSPTSAHFACLCYMTQSFALLQLLHGVSK